MVFQASIRNRGIADASQEGRIATSPMQVSDDFIQFKMSAHQNISRNPYSYNRVLNILCSSQLILDTINFAMKRHAFCY